MLKNTRSNSTSTLDKQNEVESVREQATHVPTVFSQFYFSFFLIFSSFFWVGGWG